jgi:hypothetical protein
MQMTCDAGIGGTRPRRSRPATGNGLLKATDAGELSCKELGQHDKILKAELDNRFDKMIFDE